MAKYELKCHNNCFLASSLKKKDFALLDIRTTKALRKLQDNTSVRFEAVISPSPSDDQSSQPEIQNRNEICNISLNIYGREALAVQVGAILTEEGRFLQHPLLLNYGMEYSNPHYLVASGLVVDFNKFVKCRQYGSNFQQSISTEVTKLLDSLDFIEGDVELPPITAIQTPLLR